jgi:hypothetical protein
MKLNLVPPRQGLLWVRLGMKTLWRQPLAMAGLFFMYIASVTVVSLVPVLGIALSLVLMPAATLGLMAATREADQGRFPMPLTLISAFRQGSQNSRAMLWLGAMYAGALLIAMGISALFDDGQFARVYLGAGLPSEETVNAEGFMTALWVGMGLYIPVVMLFWHAPALVHWHGVSPSKSLFFSATACWRNKGAMLVYAATWMACFLFFGMGLALIGALMGSTRLISVMMLPAILLMASMFFTSFYFTFRDSFAANAGDGEVVGRVVERDGVYDIEKD